MIRGFRKQKTKDERDKLTGRVKSHKGRVLRILYRGQKTIHKSLMCIAASRIFMPTNFYRYTEVHWTCKA
jgi:hypothetical protein